MVIQHNMAALNANNKLNSKNEKLAAAAEKLSSGLAINKAGDDAAGLAVSEKMRTQIRGLKQSIRNTQDGISLIQTFEGALGATVTIIRRAKELAVQAANGTYDTYIDRQAVEVEYRQLCDEINQLADTDFNGLVMLNGGCMADGFTFVSESGTKWLTPSNAEFPENSFVSTFRQVPGFPEIEMSIELLPDATSKMTTDKELLDSIAALNRASVKSFYDEGIPTFSIEGLEGEYCDKISIETIGNEGIIRVATSKSGLVDVARVTCTEMPHYASTFAKGKWESRSTVSVSGINPAPKADTPGNERFDVSKYTESYVSQNNSAGVTRAERQAYMDWIGDTPDSYARLIPDDEYNEDTDALQFTWSLNGEVYENEVGPDGVPINGATIPVYPDGYSGGPQIYIENVKFRYDDEDMKAGAYWNLYAVNDSTTMSTYYNGKLAEGARIDTINNKRLTDIWLDHGNQTVTLTYNKAEDKWYDNFGGSGDWGTYSLTDEVWTKTDSYYISNGYVDRNLYNFYEADGKLPDGFQLSSYITCPKRRSSLSSGYVFNQNAEHNDRSSSSGYFIVDFKVNEYDPENPDIGGVDYKVAKHGATYTYDGLTQPDGTVGVWRDSEGNAVNLEEEGVYLPANPNNTYIMKLHDGMTITVNNPTMVGADFIKADIRFYDQGYSSNAYRNVYDTITYSDGLILQTGSRTKDSIEFTFSYRSDDLGGLNADLNCSAKGLGMNELSLATQEDANYAIDRLDHALSKVSMIRSTFGAAQNRLEHKIENIKNNSENIISSESQIRDTDIASEMLNYTKEQILVQSTQSILAQSNQLPQGILELLGV
ncbi:MAG: hypothetical protein E7478_07890 [Ruminococcaceae bacterium]|nr:hypothetical protein [Oscillospiraceae bacterium]